MKVYRVKEWSKNFENSRTRMYDRLSWVPVPNKHDGEGFRTIMEHEDGIVIYGCWHLILQVASKCFPRGTLVKNDGSPHTPRSIAVKTGWINVSDIDKALKFLSSPEVGWLEELTDSALTAPCQSGDSGVIAEYQRPDSALTAPCQSGDSGVIAEYQRPVSALSAPCQRPVNELNRIELNRIERIEEGEGREDTPPPSKPNDFGSEGWDLDHVLEISSSPDVAAPKEMAQKCFDHYAAAGWVDANGNRVGRTVNSLKALLRKWRAREASFGKGNGSTPTPTPSNRPRASQPHFHDLVQDVCRDLWEHRNDDEGFRRHLSVWRDKTKDVPIQDGKSVLDEALEIIKYKKSLVSKGVGVDVFRGVLEGVEKLNEGERKFDERELCRS